LVEPKTARNPARAEQQLRSQYEIVSALALSDTLEQAGPQILASICRSVGWPVGELWRVDEEVGVLRRRAAFALEPALQRIVTAQGDATFAKGEGFPGATWAKGGPLSSTRPSQSSPAQGCHVVAELGLRCGYGFPIHTSDGRIFALLTFYAHELDALDDDIEPLLQGVSTHLDRFAARQRAVEDHRRQQPALLAREQLAAVGEAAATLVHEIGNRLNVIYMHAQLLQRQLERMPGVDPTITRRMELMLAANERLAEWLHDFRSRAESGEIGLGAPPSAIFGDGEPGSDPTFRVELPLRPATGG
jgi:GAF domain-containing protein